MSGEQSQGKKKAGKKHGDKQPTTAEKIVMGISVLFTAAIVGYVLWQTFFVPTGTVDVSITQTSIGEPGEIVTVTLTNNKDVGLISATTTVSCGNTSKDFTFNHVPASSKATGHVVCPRNVTPQVSLIGWTEP